MGFDRRRRNEVRAALKRINDILWSEWNPIGCCPKDEYESYAGQVYMLLRNGATRDDLFIFLENLERELASPGSLEARAVTCTKLLEIGIASSADAIAPNDDDVLEIVGEIADAPWTAATLARWRRIYNECYDGTGWRVNSLVAARLTVLPLESLLKRADYRKARQLCRTFLMHADASNSESETLTFIQVTEAVASHLTDDKTALRRLHQLLAIAAPSSLAVYVIRNAVANILALDPSGSTTHDLRQIVRDILLKLPKKFHSKADSLETCEANRDLLRELAPLP